MNDYISHKWRGGMLNKVQSPRIIPKSEFLLSLEAVQMQNAAEQTEIERRAAEDRQKENRRILGLIEQTPPNNLLRITRKK